LESQYEWKFCHTFSEWKARQPRAARSLSVDSLLILVKVEVPV
jgi:hypothetical protein